MLNQSHDPSQLRGSAYLCKLNDYQNTQWRASTTKRNNYLLTDKLLRLTRNIYYNKQFFLPLRNPKMMVHFQQPDEKGAQAKYFPLFLCSPDVSGLIWSRNQIFISLENYPQHML